MTRDLRTSAGEQTAGGAGCQEYKNRDLILTHSLQMCPPRDLLWHEVKDCRVVGNSLQVWSSVVVWIWRNRSYRPFLSLLLSRKGYSHRTYDANCDTCIKYMFGCFSEDDMKWAYIHQYCSRLFRQSKNRGQGNSRTCTILVPNPLPSPRTLSSFTRFIRPLNALR